MAALIFLLLNLGASLFKSKSRLEAENAALRQQLIVLQRKVHVTMSPEMCHRLTAGKHTPERCLEAAFRFLLDREPKESILGRFDVTVISRYFPEFGAAALSLAVLMELFIRCVSRTIRWPPPGYLENGVWRDGLCCARLMHFCAAILSASTSSLTALPQVYIDLTRL
jgi:hypothetical protein